MNYANILTRAVAFVVWLIVLQSVVSHARAQELRLVDVEWGTAPCFESSAGTDLCPPGTDTTAPPYTTTEERDLVHSSGTVHIFDGLTTIASATTGSGNFLTFVEVERDQPTNPARSSFQLRDSVLGIGTGSTLAGDLGLSLTYRLLPDSFGLLRTIRIRADLSAEKEGSGSSATCSIELLDENGDVSRSASVSSGSGTETENVDWTHQLMPGGEFQIRLTGSATTNGTLLEYGRSEIDNGEIEIVSSLDLLAIDDLKPVNTVAHHTDRYNDTPDLVLRRDALMRCELHLSPEYDESLHTIDFVAEHTFDGPPMQISIPLRGDPLPPTLWGARLFSVSELGDGTKKVVAEIRLPFHIAIGDYRFSARVTRSGQGEVASREFPRGVVILFNPWGDRDQVYMGSGAERREYVLRENGIIWVGRVHSRQRKRWRYSQFSARSLRTSLSFLSELGTADRSNANVVGRKLKRIRIGTVNQEPILEGKWECLIYFFGTNPHYWSGSDQILERYEVSGTVSYGQCWAFAGLLTTLGRSLGIPTRPITNYMSGEDYEDPEGVGAGIDLYVTRNGRRDRGASDDFVWNFHVWCESWMKRGDRPFSDGWQILDGTDHVGPAPQSAVRERTGGDFDVAFVTAEVDGDERIWRLPRGANDLVRVDSTRVGHAISTKFLGSAEPTDVTALYKTPEVLQLGAGTSFAQLQSSPTVDVGDSISWSVILTNPDSVRRSTSVSLVVDAIDYDGSFIRELASRQSLIQLDPGQEETIELTLEASEYVADLGISTTMEITAFAQIIETDNVYVDTSRTEVEVSRLSFDTEDLSLIVGETTPVSVTWTNPLPIPIAEATISFAVGRHLTFSGQNEVSASFVGIEPGQTITIQQPLTGSQVGNDLLAVELASAELNGIGTSIDVRVFSPPLVGNVNGASGLIVDVLTANGTAATDTDRRLVIDRNGPLELTVASPPSNPSGPAPFVMYIWSGPPGPGTRFLIPFDIGVSAMPMPVNPDQSPQPMFVANNIGFPEILGLERWPGPQSRPAPSTLLSVPQVGRPGVVTIQGLILDRGSIEGRVAVTNGMTIELQ